MGQAEGKQAASEMKLETRLEAAAQESLERDLQTPSPWEKLPLAASHPPSARSACCDLLECLKDPTFCGLEAGGSD